MAGSQPTAHIRPSDQGSATSTWWPRRRSSATVAAPIRSLDRQGCRAGPGAGRTSWGSARCGRRARRSPACRSRPAWRCAQEPVQCHWSCWSPPGVPKASQGSPSRSARRRRQRGARPLAGRRARRAARRSSQNICAPRAEAEAELGDAGELCSQPPLGVADDHVAPAVDDVDVAGVAGAVARRDAQRVGSPTGAVAPVRPERRGPRTAGGSTGRRAARASPGAASARRRAPTSARAPLGVGGVEQPGERHVDEVGVAVPGLAVGEGELGALDHRVDVARRRRVDRVQVEAGEQASCCRKTGPWPHGPVLQTAYAVVVEA